VKVERRGLYPQLLHAAVPFLVAGRPYGLLTPTDPRSRPPPPAPSRTPRPWGGGSGLRAGLGLNPRGPVSS